MEDGHNSWHKLCQYLLCIMQLQHDQDYKANQNQSIVVGTSIPTLTAISLDSCNCRKCEAHQIGKNVTASISGQSCMVRCQPWWKM